MKKKLRLGLVAVVGVLSMLVPIAASAGETAAKPRPVCVERNLPGGLHFQIGYCP